MRESYQTLEQIRSTAAEVRVCGLVDERGRPTRIVVRWRGEMTEAEWVLCSDGGYAPVAAERVAQA